MTLFAVDDVVAARAHLHAYGVCAITAVVDAELCYAAVVAIERFLGVDRRDPSTWARAPAANDGIVPLHHHAAQWAIRQHPPLVDVFAALWGTDDLRVTFDRATFRPPSPSAPLRLHWDVDPATETRRVLQGMLYLVDVDERCAPTTTSPRWFRDRAGAIARADAARQLDVDAADVVRVAAPRGTIVVWDALSPHGAAPNTSTTPRFAQAVTYHPPDLWPGTDADRVALFERGCVPDVWRGLVGQVHPERGPPPPLTALGRRLVGRRP